ncbi:YSIRK-type signal peptide-containing protein [Staphylococcus xylosus]|uniref:YSIRK-type signal peptide-containing protein n=1 Tax=Staphylococcus xylosus TaxID=1288 RepID=UPI0030C290E3
MFIKKHEKFGIRKYKLGAASVLLGTCLAIGLSASGEAKASETTNEETKIDSKHIDSNNQNSVAESKSNTSNEVATNSEITAPNDTSLNVNDVQKTESISNDKK